MNPKYFLFALSFSLLGMSIARAEFLDANGILRWNNGDIRYMTQLEASGTNPLTMKKDSPDVCESYGAHLPTARELAKEAQARGAKGILEGNHAGIPDGYYEIWAINPDGQEDRFYFNNDGYKTDGALGGKYFWSSSASRISSYFAYSLNRDSGHFGTDVRSASDTIFYNVVVRCFPGH